MSDDVVELRADRDGWKRDALGYLAQRDDARAAARRYQSMADRLLADLDAVRRTIEQFERGLPPVEDWQTTATADGLHMLGMGRVLCETAIEDYGDTTFPHVELAAAPSPEQPSDDVARETAPLHGIRRDG